MRRFFVKPFVLLAITSIMILSSSCNKKADVTEADLIGTWDIGQAAVDIKVGPISLINFLKTALQLSDQEAEDYMDELIAEFDYISGGTITFRADYSYQLLNGDLDENGTWELDEDKLYLTITGEVLDDTPLTIESMNGSSALLIVEEDQEVDFNEDGSTDFTAKIIIEVNLSKQ